MAKNKVILVENIRPSNRPEMEDGKLAYKMCYVQGGVAHEVYCSKDIFNKIKSENLTRKVTSSFNLTVSKDGVVEHIKAEDKVRSMGPLNKEGSESTTNVLIASKLESGGFALDAAPLHMTDEATTEVLELLEEKQAGLKPGDYLDSSRKYKVFQVSETESGVSVQVTVPHRR